MTPVPMCDTARRENILYSTVFVHLNRKIFFFKFACIRSAYLAVAERWVGFWCAVKLFQGRGQI